VQRAEVYLSATASCEVRTFGEHSRRLDALLLLQLQVADAAGYVDTLRQQRITLDVAERSSAIWDAVSAAASSVGGCVPTSFHTDLLEVGEAMSWLAIRSTERKARLEGTSRHLRLTSILSSWWHGHLQEVTNLVESPTVILGSFDSGFLSLPRCNEV
jgi:glycyl-tRNA synthetase beta subunit